MNSLKREQEIIYDYECSELAEAQLQDLILLLKREEKLKDGKD